MIRLKSKKQAEALRRDGKIPELVALRMSQLEGEDGFYDPQQHGFIIVLEDGDDIDLMPEIAEDGLIGLLDPESPGYEFLEPVIENGQTVWEMAIAIDNEKTIAVFFLEDPELDERLLRYLRKVHP